jgi:hypothetical protein
VALPEWFGQGAYYVRAYRPESGDLSVMIIADTDNDPVASSTNRFDEIAVLAAEAVTDIPPIRHEDLGKTATWIDCIPAHRSFGETYYEMSSGSTGSGRHSPTSRYLRHAEVEELVKGPVGRSPSTTARRPDFASGACGCGRSADSVVDRRTRPDRCLPRPGRRRLHMSGQVPQIREHTSMKPQPRRCGDRHQPVPADDLRGCHLPSHPPSTGRMAPLT